MSVVYSCRKMKNSLVLHRRQVKVTKVIRTEEWTLPCLVQLTKLHYMYFSFRDAVDASVRSIIIRRAFDGCNYRPNARMWILCIGGPKHTGFNISYCSMSLEAFVCIRVCWTKHAYSTIELLQWIFTDRMGHSVYSGAVLSILFVLYLDRIDQTVYSCSAE